MSNWSPKPLRPKDPAPLFQQDDSYVVKSSSSLTPIQRQRIQDGTPYTRGSQYQISPLQAAQSSSPHLFLEEVSKSSDDKLFSIDADDVVKSFLAGDSLKKSKVEIEIEDDDDDDDDDGEENTSKAASSGFGAKAGAAVGKVAQTAVNVAGKVVGTAVGLSHH